MGNLRRKYQTFLLRNRNKGIPDLMLWICIANAIVFILDYFFQLPLVELLLFKPDRISSGEVWRLFSCIFTFAAMADSLIGPILGALISIMFYYWVGKVLEGSMGTLRFNLFYIAGILISDLYLLLIYWIFDISPTANAFYLNLSMFLGVASIAPEQKVYIYFIIPVKMKWIAWLDIGLCVYQTVNILRAFSTLFSIFPAFYRVGLVLFALYPFASFINYFLFFGKKSKNLLPNFRGQYRRNTRRQQFGQPPRNEPNPDWARNYRSASAERPYRHKCTVCGRTDTTCPGLEFRYCSRCKGYFCYCIDHINNHTHVE